MSYLPFALTAYILNTGAVLIDKFLLNKSIGHPLKYIFYVSLFSLTSLVLIPFIQAPTWFILSLASLSTILWSTGAYWMFTALKHGSAARVIPVIGTLVPTFLLLYSFFNRSLTHTETLAVTVLIIGLAFVTMPTWLSKEQLTSKLTLLYEVLSALFFAISYLVLRQAYIDGNFLTVLSYSRVVLIPLILIILAIPLTRKLVLDNHTAEGQVATKKENRRSKLLFLSAQAFGGTAELLLTYSISLASPALVNSLQGVQYALMFFASLFLSKKYPAIFGETFTPWTIASRLTGIGFISFGLYLLAFYGQS